jgi:hypothetical protein
VLAPAAVSVDEAPEHIVAGVADTVTLGKGLIVIVTVPVPVHPFGVVAVTVYVVVTVGEAVTVAPVVALSPVAGDHVKLEAVDAVAVSACDPPEHNVTGDGDMVTVGFG